MVSSTPIGGQHLVCRLLSFCANSAVQTPGFHLCRDRSSAASSFANRAVHGLHTHRLGRRLEHPRRLRRVYAYRQHQHSTVLVNHRSQAIPRTGIELIPNVLWGGRLAFAGHRRLRHRSSIHYQESPTLWQLSVSGKVRQKSILLATVSVRDKHSFQMLDDPRCRLAVPFGRNRTFFPLPCHQSCQCRRELVWIGSNEFVRPDRDGLRTFSIVA